MSAARRVLAGTAILGVVIALVLIQQRRGDEPAGDVVDDALAPIDDGGTTREAAPAAPLTTDRTPSVASATGDEASGTCSQILADANAFAEMEQNAAQPNQESEWSESRFRTELQRGLAGSADPELFLTALLMERPWAPASDEPPDYAALLDLGLRAANSGSPLLAWHALSACVDVGEYCPFPHLEQRLLEADRDNAEAWALAAMLRHRRGDVASALAAMQDAGRASTSTWHWTETIAMAERSLAARTEMPYPVRMDAAFGMAASALPGDLGGRLCRAESAASRAWGEACLAFGSLRAEHNEGDMARGLAYGIRERALTALGDGDRAEEVLEEYALYSVERMTRGLPLLQPLLRAGPERLHAYLGAIEEFGEIEGVRRFFRQELPPLMERAGLLEREGARECVAQLFEAPTAVGTLSATFRDYPVEAYPLRVGDQLLFVGGQSSLPTSLRVGPDGAITLRGVRGSAELGVPVIAAVGKTIGQIKREIGAILSERNPSTQPSAVYVFLVSRRSSEELQNEFDKALREAGSR